MSKYEVIVGNVGTVFNGTNFHDARRNYLDYVRLSRTGKGRAAGEPVTLMRDDEIVKEYHGTVYEVEGATLEPEMAKALMQLVSERKISVTKPKVPSLQEIRWWCYSSQVLDNPKGFREFTGRYKEFFATPSPANLAWCDRARQLNRGSKP